MPYLALGVLHHSRQTLALLYLRMIVPVSLNMDNICRHFIRIQRARNLLKCLPLEIRAIGLQTTYSIRSLSTQFFLIKIVGILVLEED